MLHKLPLLYNLSSKQAKGKAKVIIFQCLCGYPKIVLISRLIRFFYSKHLTTGGNNFKKWDAKYLQMTKTLIINYPLFSDGKKNFKSPPRAFKLHLGFRSYIYTAQHNKLQKFLNRKSEATI
jgi:hypothetical protein